MAGRMFLLPACPHIAPGTAELIVTKTRVLNEGRIVNRYTNVASPQM
jgi:hypothetical protein